MVFIPRKSKNNINRNPSYKLYTKTNKTANAAIWDIIPHSIDTNPKLHSSHKQLKKKKTQRLRWKDNRMKENNQRRKKN